MKERAKKLRAQALALREANALARGKASVTLMRSQRLMLQAKARRKAKTKA